MIIVFLMFPIIFNEKIAFHSHEELGKHLKTKCNSIMNQCCLAELELIWEQFPENQLIIIEYLQIIGGKPSCDFLKQKFNVEENKYLKFSVLAGLLQQNDQDNLSFLIDLLGNTEKIGKENQQVNEMALLYLQAHIPVQYEFDWVRFEKDKTYQEEIQGTYRNWLIESQREGNILYDEKFQLFSPHSLPDSEITKHVNWYINSR